MSMLVDRPEESASSEPYESPRGEVGGIIRYRSVSRVAIIALILTVISLMAFGSSLLIFLPLTSLILGFVARRSIIRYPDELVGKVPANLATFGSLAILVGSISLHAYVYATEVPDGYERISFSLLQPSKGSRVPVSEEALSFDGEKVFIKGYVYPGERRTDLNAFVLVRDKGDCCFGGQPKLTEMIYVKLENDLTVDYSWKMRKLAGIFSINRQQVNVGDIQTGYYRLKADYLK